MQTKPHQKKAPTKGSHVLPHEIWASLQEPLHAADWTGGSGESSTPITRDAEQKPVQITSARRSSLAASRVKRDQLMRTMEELILQEAELASAYELFDYTRKRCSKDHGEIVEKLRRYEAILHEVQQRQTSMRLDGIEDTFTSEEERQRWRHTAEMVNSTLPELLLRLEENIDINSQKIRNIQEKMDEIRARRLTVREEIAVKEEDIAIELGR